MEEVYQGNSNRLTKQGGGRSRSVIDVYPGHSATGTADISQDIAEVVMQILGNEDRCKLLQTVANSAFVS